MDEIIETILKLHGKPGIDTSYLAKAHPQQGHRRGTSGYGEPDSSLEEVCWEFNGDK